MRIITITTKDIEELDRISQVKPTLVRYHSPNCGHCIAMEPEWKLLTTPGLFKDKNVAIVDIDVSVANKINHPSAKNAITTGVPSIYFLKGSQMTEYKGDRSSKKMADFVNSHTQLLSDMDNVDAGKIIDSIDTKLKKIGNNYETFRPIKYPTTPRKRNKRRKHKSRVAKRRGRVSRNKLHT